jgi:hypothetical protein
MKTSKRILSVKIKRMFDDSPDTSYMGEYSNTRASEFSIDRAHAEDCASVREDIKQAKQTLEHVQQTIGDIHHSILAQYNGTLANEKLDSERDALGDAYNQVGELFDSIDECDCGERGDMARHEYRYFNPSVNYVDKHGKLLPDHTPKEVRAYVRQDYNRMESLNNRNWCCIGIITEAEYVLLSNRGSSLVQRLTSGGLWGIESDSERAYIESVEKEELANLKEQLLAIGFSKRAVSAAFKNVEEIQD